VVGGGGECGGGCVGMGVVAGVGGMGMGCVSGVVVEMRNTSRAAGCIRSLRLAPEGH
jgi:hypothetical protein